MVLLVIALDYAAKALVRSSLSPQESVPLIPSVLHLTYVQNTGAAFGLFRGHPGVFVLASAGIAGWIVWELRHQPSRRPLTAVSLALILGGAIGNVLDRLRWGYVVDFIDARVWPVFNLADSAITVGVTLLLLSQTGWWRKGRGRHVA